MEILSGQKINMEIMALNITQEQINLIYSFRSFHPKTADTHFLRAHGKFSKIGKTLSNKTRLNKSKKIKIISSIFYEPNGIRLEIKYRKKTGKITNMWRLNNIHQRTNQIGNQKLP